LDYTRLAAEGGLAVTYGPLNDRACPVISRLLECCRTRIPPANLNVRAFVPAYVQSVLFKLRRGDACDGEGEGKSLFREFESLRGWRLCAGRLFARFRWRRIETFAPLWRGHSVNLPQGCALGTADRDMLTASSSLHDLFCFFCPPHPNSDFRLARRVHKT
jgi:hypothetical protein